jgi:hypothetical protein
MAQERLKWKKQVLRIKLAMGQNNGVMKNFPERWQSELRGINSCVYQVSV